MPRNGSGTFTLVSGNPVVSGTVIESTWANNTLADIADSITNSLARNGEGGMTAALRLVDGTVSVPGLAFANETGSGLYRAAAGDIGLTVLGSRILRLQAAGATVTGTLTTGNLVVDDNSTLGSSNTDTLAVNARITTDLEPNDNNAKDIGTSGRNWRDGFFGRNLSVGGTLGVTGVATFTANPTLGSGAVNGVPYLNGSKSLVSGSNLVFDGSKLGIGAASPYSTLDVGTTGAEVLTSVFTTGVSDLNFRIGFSNGVSGSSGSNQGKLGLFYLGVGEAASVSFIRGGGATDGSMAFRTDNAERMRIDSSGNVGIGVIPSAWNAYKAFQMSAGSILSFSTNDYRLVQNVARSGANLDYLNNGRANMYLMDGVNGGHIWYTAPSGTAGNAISFTQAMTLDASGNLLVGTTASANGRQMLAFNNAAQSGIRLIHSSTTYNGQAMVFVKADNSTLMGSIYCDGSSTSYSTTSDYRLKENVAPMTGALEKVAALKPCTYTWKADGSAGQGFIAHELQEVVPDCVTGEKDAVEIIDELDDEGNKIGTKEVPRYQGVDTSFLVATLVAAIQELKAEVDALKSVPAA
jgi:hypothetical protein